MVRTFLLLVAFCVGGCSISVPLESWNSDVSGDSQPAQPERGAGR